MKSYSIVILIAVLSGWGMWAADASAQWQVGGILDLNFATASVEPEVGNRAYSMRTAFGIGAVVDYPLAPQIDLHGQIMLQGKGMTLKDPDFERDIDWKVTYIEIPVLLRYTLQTEASAQPYVAVGPSFGLLQSAKFTDGEHTEDDEDAKSLDMSLALAAGAKLPRGRNTFFGEVRYAYGLINVVEDPDVNPSVKHRGLQILAGVTFPIGGN